MSKKIEIFTFAIFSGLFFRKNAIKSFFSIFFKIFIFSFCGLVFAEVNLYKANIFLKQTEKNVDVKHEALALGFKKVLLKLSTKSSILENKQIKRILKNKDKIDFFVLKFGLLKSFAEELNFEIIFDEKKIDDLLEKIGYEPVKNKRPLTLIWLSLEDNNSARIINDDEKLKIEQELIKTSKKFEIPVIMPLFDLIDRNEIKLTDVLNYNFDKLSVNALGRYGAEVVLVGNAYKFENNWQFRWKLSFKNKKAEWFSESDNFKEEAGKIIENLSEKIFFKDEAEINDVAFKNETLKIFVSGIDSLEKYTLVEDYLKKIMLVKSVELIELNSDKAVFNLKTNADKNVINKVLKKDNFLSENAKNYNYIENEQYENYENNDISEIDENKLDNYSEGVETFNKFSIDEGPSKLKHMKEKEANDEYVLDYRLKL